MWASPARLMRAGDYAASIVDLYVELDVSRPLFQSADLPDVKSGRIQVGDRPGEDVPIERIEHLTSEVDLDSFVDGKDLRDSEVFVAIPEASNV